MAANPGMKRAVIYCRQSLDRAGDGLAVERQEAACRGLAAARGWDVVGVETDNSISGYSGKARPAWERVLERATSGAVDIIITWQLDRITRNMNDLEHLIKLGENYGVGVVTASGDLDLTQDSGRMVARILAAVASGEVERKATRQRLQSEQRAAKGQPKWSRRPFGFNLDKTHRADEANELRRAYERVAAGETVASVAYDMAARGITGTSGVPFTPATLGTLLHDRRNWGRLSFRGEDAGPGDWEPIVSPELADTVTAMRKRKGQGGSPGRHRDTWLTGVATCSKCGETVHSVHKARMKVRSYTCQRGCLTLDQEFADAVVLRKLVAILEDSGYQHQAENVATENAEAIAGLRLELDQLAAKIDAATEDYGSDLITREAYLKLVTGWRSRADDAQSELDTLTASSSAGYFDPEVLASSLDQMEGDEVRRFIGDRVRVTLTGKGRGRGKVETPDLVDVQPILG